MTDFEWTKSQFYVPEGMIYLDGNSLVPAPKCQRSRWRVDDGSMG